MVPVSAKMPYYCTVPRCTSMAGKAKNVSFHQFPRDEELAKLWNRILKRGKPYTKYSKVCSLHFKPEDYTITSVGKNKGQWRTLRKDAIPSQNLPSESPVPYTRRSSGCWVPGQPSLTDPLVQQQMAQAIYMQTMLAMQAAGASESLSTSETPTPESAKPSPSSSSLSEIELLLRRDTEQPKEVTYKCHECTKCFKDPDVYLLHKRTHKKDTTRNIEKENYSTNIQDGEDTLRANPILANLLKTSMRLEPENSVNNILTVENQIMAALASNMEAYIRTLSSMISNQANAIETEDKGDDESDYDDETNDGDSNVCKEHKADEDMCVDAIDNDDTPMDEQQDDTDGTELNHDENDEERNNFQITVSVNRLDTSAENVNSHESTDDNSTKEVSYDARNDTEMKENHRNLKDKSINDNDSREKIKEASDTCENIDTTNPNEVENDATDHESNECASDNKIRNEATGNVIGENDDTSFSLDENEVNAGTHETDGISTKNELNEAYDENDAAAIHEDTSDALADCDENLDEMTADDSDDGKLVKAGIPCDSYVETVDLIRVDIESET